MKKLYSLIIVDDEWSIRSSLSELFPWAELGFTVKGIFENGLKALSYTSAENIDVILTDIRMPIMDGLELTYRAKKINKDISVILLSAYDDFSYAQKAIEFGAVDFLVKPISYSGLIECFSALYRRLEEKNITTHNLLSTKTFEDYIRKNFLSFSIQDCSEYFGITEDKLKEYIDLNIHKKINRILLDLKMEKATEMLDITGTKIFEIAQALGYTNSNNFTRAFLSYYKISPSDYRKKK